MSKRLTDVRGWTDGQVSPLVVSFVGRPRSWARTNTYNGRRITPKPLRVYKRAAESVMRIATLARSNWPSDADDARFSVSIAFRLPDRRRCDLDNLAKAVLDAGNRLLWRDDSQIDRLDLTKTHRASDAGWNMTVEVCRDGEGFIDREGKMRERLEDE
ncbi:RusA family crossover junction endodeoxyribonuclease [Myxococcota bacterium]|nr:RusA family crossover junction endodeoxyribonuclease [Myxococcota bacterium]